MIRKLLNGDIDRVADIWLKTNLKAHYFISNQYWKSNYELVKEMMSQSEVYVYEEDKMIQGFVGLNAEYIEGIFVSDEMQSCGIGKLLFGAFCHPFKESNFADFKKKALQRKKAVKTGTASPKEFTDWLYQQSNVIVELTEI